MSDYLNEATRPYPEEPPSVPCPQDHAPGNGQVRSTLPHVQLPPPTGQPQYLSSTANWPYPPSGQDLHGYRPPLGADLQLAGPITRLTARLVDFLLIYAPVLVILYLIALSDVESFFFLIAGLFIPRLILFVYEWLMLARDGQTLGKKVMKIRVVPLLTQGHLTGGQAAGRAAGLLLLSGVPLFGFVYFLVDVLWQLLDRPNRQCLHDKMVMTVVIRE